MKLFKYIQRYAENQKLLFWLFLLVLILPNLMLSITEPMNWAGRLCNIILPLSLYYLAMSYSKNIGKTYLYLFPAIFLAAFQFVLLYLFKRSIIAVDMFLNLVTTNSTEAMELLDNLLPAIIIVVILYVSTLTAAVMSVVKQRTLPSGFSERNKIWAQRMAMAGLLTLGTAYYTNANYEMKSDLYPANVCYNIYLATQRSEWTRNYPKTSAEFSYHATPTHPEERREIYVMVIGETARACNWSLMGYARATNPMLEKTKDVVFYPRVLSESNTTHKSVPMLMSSISAYNFDSIYYRKGIITAFKEAGFHTEFISNQRYNNSFIDFFGMEAHHYDFIKEETDAPKYNPSDGEMLQRVADIVQKGKQKQFIILHMYGSHFNYRERYPASDAHFLPDTPADADPAFKNSLLNAYDNTIRYTDTFLARLIGMLASTGADAALLYTSDHGEDIFDDHRELFLHASPVPSYYQMHVPFLAWSSASYQANNSELWEAIICNSKKNVSSTSAFFHTMLQIAGVKSPYRNDSLSVANAAFNERPRVYLDDHNKARPLTDIGLDKEDFELFKKYDISGW